MRKLANLLIILLIFLPTTLSAQTDSKYLSGAVPEVNGKVVFQKEFDLKGASQDQIYDRILSWITERMQQNKNTNSRIVFSDKGNGSIAATGEEYLVFNSSALSLDRTLINYQVTINCHSAKCLVNIEKIRYTYQDKEKYTAEEWITDNRALYKNKTKIIRGIAKFRIKTIDFVDNMFDSAQAALGIAKTAPVASQPLQTTTNTALKSSATSFSLAGYKQITPDKIPGNVFKMLSSNDWMLITVGNKDKFNMMTAKYGAFGHLFDKPIAMCFIHPTRYTYQFMEDNDTYTFSFYPEAYRSVLEYCGTVSGKDTDKIKNSGLTPITTPNGNQAFSEAWLIIECRKLVGQSLTPDAICDKDLKKEWNTQQLFKMYMGEITNVWMK